MENTFVIYRCLYACGAPSNRMDVERKLYALTVELAGGYTEHIYRLNGTTSQQNKRALNRSPQKISKHGNNE